MDRYPTPRPGDVIFVYSPTVNSCLSCLVQRFKLTSGDRSGPWFSHVAIALDEDTAFEASPTHRRKTKVWSWVPHVVIGGKKNGICLPF
jgi:hypothetical protein